MQQGQIWLLERRNEPPRPVLVLTRDEALAVLHNVTVAPLTRTIRGIATEVRLDGDDGVKVDSVATFDNVRTVRRSDLTRRLGAIRSGRWHEVCAAMRAAIAC